MENTTTSKNNGIMDDASDNRYDIIRISYPADNNRITNKEFSCELIEFDIPFVKASKRMLEIQASLYEKYKDSMLLSYDGASIIFNGTNIAYHMIQHPWMRPDDDYREKIQDFIPGKND